MTWSLASSRHLFSSLKDYESKFTEVYRELCKLVAGQDEKSDPIHVQQYLRSFRAFAAEGKLSKAAHRLDCHPDTVSNHICDLNDLLDTILTQTIVEKNRSVRKLTDVGDALAAWLLVHPEHGPLPPRA